MQSSNSDLVTTRLRVSRLKSSSRVLRVLAGELIPSNLSRQEAQKEKRYSEWLGQASERMDQLASEGSSIVAMMNSPHDMQAIQRSDNRPNLQRLRLNSTQPTWNFGQSNGSFSSLAGGGSSSVDALMNATKEMQEMNQSFNLQYLQLQQNMQQENRQFTMMSNIMKTKHDTAKSAINNVR